MRTVLFALAVLVSCGPAAAQSWREYQYPDRFFAVAFPDAPQIETEKYPIADDRAVDAEVYSVRRDDAVFKVTVAEIADTGLEESAVIGHSVKKLSAGGEVKVDIPHRISRVFGRQLSIAGPDGTKTMAAVFDYRGRLYQIEGTTLPGGNDATAEVIRFVQSLAFTGDGSNRSQEEPRGARGACADGTVAGSSTGSDQRCRRRQLLAALVTALDSDDLAGARQAYSSLTSLQNGDRVANPEWPVPKAMREVGQALENGDLTAARQAVLPLRGRRARQP